MVDITPVAKTCLRLRGLVSLLQLSLPRPIQDFHKHDFCASDLFSNCLHHNCLVLTIVIRFPTAVSQTFTVKTNYPIPLEFTKWISLESTKTPNFKNNQLHIQHNGKSQHVRLMWALGNKNVQTETCTRYVAS